MPIFEFKCHNCGVTEDIMMKTNSNDAQLCKKCGQPMYKLFSAPSFAFVNGNFSASSMKKEYK